MFRYLAWGVFSRVPDHLYKLWTYSLATFNETEAIMDSHWILTLVLNICATSVASALYIVTGSVGAIWTSIGIFENSQTRYEAAQSCIDYGFDHLENGELSHLRYIAIKQKLGQELSGTFDGSNTSFWVDFFRLDNTSSEWLETTLCANATAKVNMNGYVANPGSNCISLHYSHSFEQYYHKAMDCTLQLSFICVKTNLELPPLIEHHDMKLTFVPAGCNIVTINKPSYAQCVESCEHVYNCIAVTYEDIGTCELLEIGAEIAWEMYALETNNDFIHATKNGTVVTYYPTSVTPTVYDRFPCEETLMVTTNPVTTTTTTIIPQVRTLTAYINQGWPPVINIYEDEVTWFDGQRRCTEYGRLDADISNYGVRITTIKQTIRDRNHTEMTLWAGFFKPSTDSGWYRTNSNGSLCYGTSKTFAGQDGQCSVWNIPDTLDPYDAYTSAADCSVKHPYYCIKWPGQKLKLIDIDGWTYLSYPENAEELIIYYNMTKRQCKQACFDRPWCVGASYWEDTYICHLITAHDEHGYITYNITYDSSVNVVHMYKGPYQVTIHPKTDGSNSSQFQQTLPSCNFTTTTSSSTRVTSTPTTASAYLTDIRPVSTTQGNTCRRPCPCRYTQTYSETELNVVIENIIQNLTINKAVTSKTKRQLTSAEDTRTSAQVVGGLGVAILSVVFAGIVLLDIPRLLFLFNAD